MAREVKERPMEKTGVCLRVTGHLEMTMIINDDDDDVEHTSVNFRICVRTLFTSSMTLCMHKYHNQEWSIK